MTTPESETSSPNWGSTLKLVVAFTFVAIVGALVVRFGNIVGPLLLAFILAYVLHPLASWLTKNVKLSWRGAVTLIYLLLVVILVTLFTVTGLGAVEQILSLVGVVSEFVTNLPDFVENLSTQVYLIGPFPVDLGQFFWPIRLECTRAAGACNYPTGVEPHRGAGKHRGIQDSLYLGLGTVYPFGFIFYSGRWWAGARLAGWD